MTGLRAHGERVLEHSGRQAALLCQSAKESYPGDGGREGAGHGEGHVDSLPGLAAAEHRSPHKELGENKFLGPSGAPRRQRVLRKKARQRARLKVHRGGKGPCKSRKLTTARA